MAVLPMAWGRWSPTSRKIVAVCTEALVVGSGRTATQVQILVENIQKRDLKGRRGEGSDSDVQKHRVMAYVSPSKKKR